MIKIQKNPLFPKHKKDEYLYWFELLFSHHKNIKGIQFIWFWSNSYLIITQQSIYIYLNMQTVDLSPH